MHRTPASFWGLATRAASGRRARRRLLILTYHRVLTERDPLLPDDIDVREFSTQMELLRRHCRVLPLPDAVEALYCGRLPAAGVCITFDDGYANNHRLALPILRRYGMTATFFVATAFLDGGRMWNDTVIEAVRGTSRPTLEVAGVGELPTGSLAQRRAATDRLIRAYRYLDPAERTRQCEALAAASGAALPTDLMMTSGMVRDLVLAGMDVGAHTATHPILARISPSAAAREIQDGAARLKDIVGRPPVSFAYPNGRPDRDYTREHAEMVRAAGLALAVTTARGSNDAFSDRFQLARLAPWDRTPMRFLLRLLQSWRTRGAMATLG